MPVTVVIDDSDDEEKKVAVPVNTARSAHNAAAAASTDAKAEAGSKRAAPEEPEDKGAACTICLEPIESSGPHGPANLKCGHIFGKECIQKWIACKKEQKVAASCPQCNKKCKLSDVTPLFNLPTVVSSDAAERQELAAKLAEKDKEMERMRKELQELKQQKQQLQLQACSQQPGPQQQQLGPLASGPSGVGLSGPGTRPFAEASRNLLARHAHPHHQAQQPLQQGGWQSQGQPGLWAAHHSQPAWQLPSGGPQGHVGLVRDICFSPPPGEHSSSKGSSSKGSSRPLHVALATKGAGLLVLSGQSSRVVASYTLPSPAWSCAWSTTNQHQLAECDTLWGHTSKMVFTRATFLSPLPQQQPDPLPSSAIHETAGTAAARSLPPPVFVAADEDSCRPWVWCLRTGAVLQVLEPHNSPILSLRAGWCPGLGSVLVVCSASYLDVYTLAH
ncbi:hypothetical protein QJQ45_028798 [Haematococcus lacustris]|nr:hypothetical protein QJQ45_028798 [Haematococcus lacustris]